MDSRTRTARASESAIDNEHLVQIELADAVLDAIDEGAPAGKVRELLDHLVEFTELHFLSEALLMRLHAYTDHDEHVADHDAIIGRLHALRADLDAADGVLDEARAARVKGEILSHIRNRDAALHVFIAHQRR